MIRAGMHRAFSGLSKGMADRPSDRFMVWLLLGISLVFFVLSLGHPIPTDDVLFYSLIGRAIYEKGMMPFTFVFDHKPLLTYYLYGFYTILFPDDVPKYQVLSIVLYALTAWLTRAFSRSESWPIHFLVVMGLSIKFLNFNANTQLFFTPLILISVLLALQSRTFLGVFFSGVFSALAFNMNYSAAVIIGPTILYTFYSSGDSLPVQVRKLVQYGIGFGVAFLLVLAPLYLKDPQLVGEYFEAQRRFVAGYKKWDQPAMLGFIISALLMFALAAVTFPCQEKDRRVRNIMLVMLLFAFLSTLPPLKFYKYYLYPMVLPLVILYSLSISVHKRMAMVVVAIGLAVVAVPDVLKWFGSLNDARSAWDMEKYRRLKTLVGDEKVLSIRTDPTITYYSGIDMMQPLAWVNHPEIIYGAGQDDYYNAYLQKRPKFVTTMMVMCQPPPLQQPTPKVCAALKADYSVVMRFEDSVTWRQALVYQRKGS
jgi:hypothetical protein